jgi:hypothetical protein
VSERLRRARRGVRGGGAPPRGVQGGGPPARGFGGSAPEKIFLGRHIFAGFGPTYYRHISGTTYFRDHMILGGFRHMVFADGFLFPVKELGFWTNPGHWVRVLDAAGSYMYIVL